MSSFKYGFVKQVLIEERTDVPLPNENISLPYGLVKTVEHYLGSIGILDSLDDFKERGVPLSRIVVAMCTCILMGSNSMTRCSDWLSDINIRRESGIDGRVSQKTINRAVEILGEHADGIIVESWKGLNSRYQFEDTDVNVDGSAVVFNGTKSEMGEIGYPRDFKDQSRPQVEFMIAQLQTSGIPIFIRPFKGNTSDVEQYRDVLPDIFSMIREGSWIIMDNGGASSDISDSIVDSGNKYLTRVKMNLSDDKRVMENKDKWEYVEDGICCITHTFDSSGRTTYLFWSVDNTIRSHHAAERSVKRMMNAVRSYREGKLRKSDFVTVKKNVVAEVNVRIDVQTSFDHDEDDTEGLIEEVMGPRSGIFKLESSVQSTPSEALKKYRARASVEHLIHSFKRITGLKPLRVWKESSIKGSMILALLSEAAIAMARYELEPEVISKMDKGKLTTENRRPSTESIVWSLGHLTVCRLVEKGKRKASIYSNWNPLSERIFADIRSDQHRRRAFSGG